jgi:hypothetical protein
MVQDQWLTSFQQIFSRKEGAQLLQGFSSKVKSSKIHHNFPLYLLHMRKNNKQLVLQDDQKHFQSVLEHP